jgi:N-acetylmuramoyl-L-alanine amidase
VTTNIWLSRLAALFLFVLGAFFIVSCTGFSDGAVAELKNAGLAPEIRDQVIADISGKSLPVPDSLAALSEPETVILDPVTGFPSFPLPDGNPEPLGPAVFNSGFRDPLPRSPVWNPTGSKRVGLQVGHWNTYDLPYELRRLSPGSTSGGWTEADLNLLLARTTARFLEEAGVEVDILPTAIPIRYRAHAFVSIHADGDTSGRLNGYKITRPAISSIPEADDEFVRIMYQEYGAATGMARDSDNHISRRMTYYYAFNTRRYQHAIDLGTPAQIIETGFLTNASDREFLTGRPDLAGRGIANGILRFLALELGRTG